MPLICQAGELQRTAEPSALHKLRATPETVHVHVRITRTIFGREGE